MALSLAFAAEGLEKFRSVGPVKQDLCAAFLGSERRCCSQRLRVRDWETDLWPVKQDTLCNAVCAHTLLALTSEIAMSTTQIHGQEISPDYAPCTSSSVSTMP